MRVALGVMAPRPRSRAAKYGESRPTTVSAWRARNFDALEHVRQRVSAALTPSAQRPAPSKEPSLLILLRRRPGDEIRERRISRVETDR